MSVYTYKLHDMNNNYENNLYLRERNIYGSSRISMEQVGQIVATSAPGQTNFINEENGIYIGVSNVYAQKIGDKRYELSNLPTTFGVGNVLEVITDRKVAVDFTNYNPNTGTYTSTLADGSLDYYTADVISQNDYFPYGMLACPVHTGLPNRYESSNEYRYAFNGMETDKEVSGTGNSYTTQFRQYDPRLGRWKSLDPLMHKFPNQSPFCAFDNNPIYYTDPLGLEGEKPGDAEKPKKGDIRVIDFTDERKIYVFNGKSWVLQGEVYNKRPIVANIGTVNNGEEDDLYGGGNSGKPKRELRSFEGSLILLDIGNEKDDELEELVRDGIWWADRKSDLWDGTGTLENDQNTVLKVFFEGNGGLVTGLDETEALMKKTQVYKDLVNDISEQFTYNYKIHSDNYSDYTLNVKVLPEFNNSGLALKALVGGTQQLDILIVGTYMDTQGNLHAIIQINIWDTFGVSEDDFIKHSSYTSKLWNPDYEKYKAIGAFWLLQHQRGYKPVYTKFIFYEDIIINK